MSMGILARRVQFVLMVRMLDRADPQAPRGERLDQLNYELRLAVVLAAKDVKSFHGSRWLELRFAHLRAVGRPPTQQNSHRQRA